MTYTSKSTQCVHSGTVDDTINQGINTPIFTSTAYAYLDKSQHLYPRYFNTPNQKAVIDKVCALEHAEAGLLFSSGMAANTTALLSLLQKGDHIVFPREIYGGTQYLAMHELGKFGIEFSFTKGNAVEDFAQQIRSNTRIIYLETPSNPLLTITDLAAVADLAKSKGILTAIDNTFASPINQNPIDFGIDVVMHSGTKYLGGHSDISCGVIVSSQRLISVIYQSALCFGGVLSSETCYLLERSLKTLHIRVMRQNENALFLAQSLQTHRGIAQVFYPGLESHPGHSIAQKQMKNFGGMLSFDLKGNNPEAFLHSLQLIQPVMSLGGIESTIMQPSATSHAMLSEEERLALGITDRIMRLSVGIEEATDLLTDIEQALEKG
ncbi:MAG: aminotransferase class I/II-fold pyridoxal phosphate-dependent enzyme [Bacteroidota bacterium]